jgi:cold shock CspA family protein
MAPPAAGPMSRRRPHVGVVESFDGGRGLGTVVTTDGRRLPFHCTAIADGTRQIDEGAEVVFEVAPGALGRLEARGLTLIRA